MPELPEVQTTVDGLNETVKGKTIVDVWTDIAVKSPTLAHHRTSTKSSAFFATFKKTIVGAKILKAERRAKNIFIHLSNKQSIWIHMKMTGHMMYGRYTFDAKTKQWTPDKNEKNEALRDPFNKFLHTVFSIQDKPFDSPQGLRQLVLSDVRKFAKVTIVPTDKIDDVLNIGPEPLTQEFTLAVCTEQLMRRPTRPVKEVLLDQKIISGIGNIYSDEALWLAGIHPLRMVRDIKKLEMKKLYEAIKNVLKKGIDFGGDSTSDYRDINGERGAFQGAHNAYRMTGKPCKKRGCGGTITRIPFGGRGAHFCPIHQK
ncbi:MAG: formamidopyrimidine-DNA glycosylase, formamidopyrimidine-DNA glycosylase [Candidatus Nomurabacteria bacterium]|jgi:formamidopyrimidine-DNA glycosylase|nr:formamidopyrimidine-DNA glycosylase, formamidopyrimidine-DNA glycosylase [Candidatus Nomurabacteria bacterium]